MKIIGLALMLSLLLLVAFANANEAPTITSTAVTSAIEDETYTYDVDATDADAGDVLTYSLTEKPDGMAINSATGVITWVPDEEQIGKHTVTVKVTDDDATPLSDEETFEIFTRPHRVCGDYTSGSDIKINTDIENDNEDFYPGDKIEIEVDVENNNDNDEIENIIVEAILYDTEDGKRLVTVKSDDFNLDENDRGSVDLTVEVPNDLDTSNDLILFTYAYEDGNDDDNCDWKYDSGLEFKRKLHDLIINRVTITPETVKPGKTVEAKIDVENVGDRDEEDVYIKIKNGELGIDKKSEIFDIEEYQEDDDDEYTATVTFTVPTDAQPGKYDLEVYVYDENRKLYESGSAFITLTVEGTAQVTTTTTTTIGTATIIVEGIPEVIKELGKPISIPIKLTNTAGEDKEYKITLANIEHWAESESVITAYLTPEQTSTYYLTLTPKTDATEGQHIATITVKEGSTFITEKTLSFTVPESEKEITEVTTEDKKGVFYNLFDKTIFWIIGDLVLVVLAIFFMRMLFSKKETE